MCGFTYKYVKKKSLKQKIKTRQDALWMWSIWVVLYLWIIEEFQEEDNVLLFGYREIFKRHESLTFWRNRYRFIKFLVSESVRLRYQKLNRFQEYANWWQWAGFRNLEYYLTSVMIVVICFKSFEVPFWIFFFIKIWKFNKFHTLSFKSKLLHYYCYY